MFAPTLFEQFIYSSTFPMRISYESRNCNAEYMQWPLAQGLHSRRRIFKSIWDITYGVSVPSHSDRYKVDVRIKSTHVHCPYMFRRVWDKITSLAIITHQQNQFENPEPSLSQENIHVIRNHKVCVCVWGGCQKMTIFDQVQYRYIHIVCSKQFK